MLDVAKTVSTRIVLPLMLLWGVLGGLSALQNHLNPPTMCTLRNGVYSIGAVVRDKNDLLICQQGGRWKVQSAQNRASTS